MRTSTVLMALVGCVIVLSSLLAYQVVITDLGVVSSSNIRFLESIAYATLGLVCIGLVLAFVGLTLSILQTPPVKVAVGYMPAFMARLAEMLRDGRSSRLFVTSAVAYGSLFAVVSSTLVYQSGISFSTLYEVSTPSVVPVVCCGMLGQMPQLVVYLTQHFAIIMVPLNLILLFAVSWLVGLNAAIARFAYANRPPRADARWFGGIGAIVGLFTMCPTCAGFFLLSLLGSAGEIGVALTLPSLQEVFVAVGIPILLIVPILQTSRLASMQACSVTA